MSHLVNPNLYRLNYIIPFSLFSICNIKHQSYFDLKIYFIKNFMLSFFFRSNRDTFKVALVFVYDLKLAFKNSNIISYLNLKKSSFLNKKIRRIFRKFKKIFKNNHKKQRVSVALCFYYSNNINSAFLFKLRKVFISKLPYIYKTFLKKKLKIKKNKAVRIHKYIHLRAKFSQKRYNKKKKKKYLKYFNLNILKNKINKIKHLIIVRKNIYTRKNPLNLKNLNKKWFTKWYEFKARSRSNHKLKLKFNLNSFLKLRNKIIFFKKTFSNVSKKKFQNKESKIDIYSTGFKKKNFFRLSISENKSFKKKFINFFNLKKNLYEAWKKDKNNHRRPLKPRLVKFNNPVLYLFRVVSHSKIFDITRKKQKSGKKFAKKIFKFRLLSGDDYKRLRPTKFYLKFKKYFSKKVFKQRVAMYRYFNLLHKKVFKVKFNTKLVLKSVKYVLKKNFSLLKKADHLNNFILENEYMTFENKFIKKKLKNKIGRYYVHKSILKNNLLNLYLNRSVIFKLKNVKNNLSKVIVRFLGLKSVFKLAVILRKTYGAPNSSDMLSDAIIIRLLKKNKIKNIIKGTLKFLKMYLRKKRLGGFCILFSGRFTRKDRAMYSWLKRGKYSRSNKLNHIDYSNKRVALKYSSCSFKISLNRTVIKKIVAKFL